MFSHMYTLVNAPGKVSSSIVLNTYIATATRILQLISGPSLISSERSKEYGLVAMGLG